MIRVTLLLPLLAACATVPAPVEFPPIVAVVEQPAQIEPVDVRIRERTIPIVRPFAFIDTDGESRGGEFVTPAGVPCVMLQGALSCGWCGR